MQRRDMHLGARSFIFSYARKLRDNPTEPEAKLWEYLRKRQIEGVRFRRQHPIKRYIADFYTCQYKLIIELDGPHHARGSQAWYDQDRSEVLKSFGVTVIRFSNQEVIWDIAYVLSAITDTIIKLKNSRKRK